MVRFLLNYEGLLLAHVDSREAARRDATALEGRAMARGWAMAVARLVCNRWTNKSFCSNSSMACWACGDVRTRKGDGTRCGCEKELPTEACLPKAHGKAMGEDFFRLLGVEKSGDGRGRYEVAVSEVDAAHRKLQLLLHPDRFPYVPGMSKEAHEGRIEVAMALSARASEAAATLRDPLRRARYVLRLAGCPVDTEEGARAVHMEGGDGMEAMEWLETAMEINEAVRFSVFPSLGIHHRGNC